MYSEPIKLSKMQRFDKIAGNGFYLLTISSKSSILDFYLGFECPSEHTFSSHGNFITTKRKRTFKH